jgi:hypothetical protein
MIKIPTHGGPDGQGLPEAAFAVLLDLLQTQKLSDQEAKAIIELGLSASTQAEWNEKYKPKLIEIYKQ